MTGTCCLWSTK